MTVRVERRSEGKLLWLTIENGKGNVLDAATIAALRGALREHAQGGVHAIAFEGAGAHFSFGASVAEHRREEAPAMLEAFHWLFRDLAELAIPTAAIVRGQCLGGGLELAAWCTWIFASHDAKLGQPEIKLAVFPPMASLVLPFRIGGGAAMDLCVSGRSIDAEVARRIGLVHAVVADPTAAFEAFFAEHLAGTSASSLRYAERAVRAPLIEALRTELPALERLYLAELMETHDANEGIAAFLERRPPRFEGR